MFSKTFFQKALMLFAIFSIIICQLAVISGTYRETGNIYMTIKSISGAIIYNGTDNLSEYSNKSSIKKGAIALYNYASYLLNERKIKNIYLGSERWLFTKYGAEGLREWYWGNSKNIKLTRENQELINDFSHFTSQESVPHIILSIPIKAYIYPELLYPVLDSQSLKLDSTISRNSYDYIDKYINMYTPFTTYKESSDFLLYSQVDHHPNGLGTYLSWIELTKKMNELFPNTAPVSPPVNNVINFKPDGNDLSTQNIQKGLGPTQALQFSRIKNLNIGFFNIPFTYLYVSEMDTPFCNSPVTQYFNFSDEPSNQYEAYQYRHNVSKKKLVIAIPEQPVTELKAFIYGNSMTEAISFYYSRYFKISSTKYYSKKEKNSLNEHISAYNAFVEHFGKPDIVIGVY